MHNTRNALHIVLHAPLPCITHDILAYMASRTGCTTIDAPISDASTAYAMLTLSTYMWRRHITNMLRMSYQAQLASGINCDLLPSALKSISS